MAEKNWWSSKDTNPAPGQSSGIRYDFCICSPLGLLGSDSEQAISILQMWNERVQNTDSCVSINLLNAHFETVN